METINTETFLSKPYKLLDKYQKLLGKSVHGSNGELLIEVRQKMEFLSMLLTDIISEIEKLEKDADYDIGYTRLQMLTEAFYYFANRMLLCLSDPKNTLPGFPPGKIMKREFPFINLIRNTLIEHPSILNNSFGYSVPYGPTIKCLRNIDSKEVYVDKGLYENAKNLELGINTLIQTAIDSLVKTNQNSKR